MMWLIELLKKRPSDNTIRISRILFGLIYSWALYYNLIMQNDAIETNFFWQELSENWIIYMKYIIIALWLIPIIMWLTNICLLKSLYMRIVQIIFWIILFYISWKIVEWPILDVDTLIWFMWLLPLLAWITWKCITTKCLRFWQKVTKVRV